MAHLEVEPLPALAKGALRHRHPQASVAQAQDVDAQSPLNDVQMDLDTAEHLGRQMLKEDSWTKRIFEEFDGAACGYLWPAEFAAMSFRFEQAMGGFLGRFSFNFDDADINMEGRISLSEWREYAKELTAAFGEIRCKVAVQRILGSRKAELRRKVKHVWLFDGYDFQPSVRLLEMCSKGHKNPSIVQDVRSALASKADPNAGLASPSFNQYTPLIFLAMTPACANGPLVATAMELLILAKADVHRECGQMFTGRLLPLRFAARTQNEYGLEALQKHVNLGDVFQWAAGENAEGIMLSELRHLYGNAFAQTVEALDPYSHAASAQMRLFASPMVGGSLSPAGAQRLCKGLYDDGYVHTGQRADPNSPGLEGHTALMYMVIAGNVPTIQALMACRASLEQRDSSGATPLHYAACYSQPSVVKALLDLRADPSAVDQAGLSPWMVVGEARGFQEKQGRVGLARENASEESMRECLEMLKPEFSPGELLEKAESGIDSFLDSLGSPLTMAVLEKRLRLHESLFFNPRLAIKGAFEGRVVLRHFIDRWVHVIISLLQTDPLQGPAKLLAKYLLNATLGPDSQASCAHVHAKWRKDDNRSWYRDRLMEAVKHQLQIFATECSLLRREMDAAAGVAKQDQAATAEDLKGPSPEAVEAEAPSLERALSMQACYDLFQVPKDQVIIPESWQEDPFWRTVQERQVLRYDPSWAQQIHDGASCFLQLARLGVPKDRSKRLTGKDACVVSTLAEYSSLRQVTHSQMKELFARGFVTYSNLCNVPFQEKMKDVVSRARQAANLTVEMPSSVIPAKRLARLLEKTLEAEKERKDWEWPDRPASYLRHAYSFYILDTVRLSFVCKGETPPEQVRCCMRILQEFRDCSSEKDGVQLLRVKSGFAAGVKGDGGYADVKMLCYADLGVHVAFDGTEIPLRIIGEIQLILEGYANVKNRMHLVYEVHRGSFDRTRSR
ncbi:ankrd54 [Symbiodinium natans]|uniref:Ankrd54 protein n=1 Tax=Symbiodinium natans TaxID=878477 RepID=A0A812HP03_9DINO|nr:ankrd54 [Symbiodinium natans]